MTVSQDNGAFGNLPGGITAISATRYYVGPYAYDNLADAKAESRRQNRQFRKLLPALAGCRDKPSRRSTPTASRRRVVRAGSANFSEVAR